ncbi:patatin-like phospholipase family protein [Halovenus rubra]|uniref:Patatin-like phospholipase family protein n=2 Tax=Halovenus rubra TaxID=869890 RepID=A0ACC7DVT7_9EURY|nr:patatin-like phospholipase family protein [Halovenus rubra]
MANGDGSGEDDEPEQLELFLEDPPQAETTDGNEGPFGAGVNPDDIDGGSFAEAERPVRTAPMPSQVRYLVFSGGGAKAFAFLGALAALGELGFLHNPARDGDDADAPDDYFLDPDRIDGVAGASAGAITAGLLAGNVGLGEAYDLLTDDEEITRFFDRSDLSTLDSPTLSGTDEVTRPTAERGALVTAMGTDAAPAELQEYRTSVVDYITAQTGETVDEIIEGVQDASQVSDAYFSGEMLDSPAWWLGALLRWKFDTGLPAETIRQVFMTGHFPMYVANLLFHDGVFSGAFARQYLDAALTAGLRSAGVPPGDTVTFRDLAAGSPIDLSVVGANLSSGTADSFATGETPDIGVADAIRLSMAIPFVYRPTTVADGPHAGTWVDGGLINNFPLHAYTPPDRAASPSVLGLNLDEPAGEIGDLGDFVGAVSGSLFARTTENQIYTPIERTQVIDLPTGDLSMLGFTPTREAVEEAMQTAAQSVLEYFGQQPDNAAYNAERAIEERIHGEEPSGGPSPLPEIPTKPDDRRYSRGYLQTKFMDEMLAKIKAGDPEADGWEPHPLAFLLDPMVVRGDADGPAESPEQLVNPEEEPETYRDGVSFWDRSTTPKKGDDWYFVHHRRPPLDAGHMTSRWYLESELYEYERIALEDKYLNIRTDADTVESPGGAKKDYTAIEIGGVPVETKTAERLEFDTDPAADGYHEMSEAEQAAYRAKHFPVDAKFPDHRPFGEILGGLPKGTVQQKKAAGETSAGWVYPGPNSDARRIKEIQGVEQ